MASGNKIILGRLQSSFAEQEQELMQEHDKHPCNGLTWNVENPQEDQELMREDDKRTDKKQPFAQEKRMSDTTKWPEPWARLGANGGRRQKPLQEGIHNWLLKQACTN
jgi:hypothetical protein